MGNNVYLIPRSEAKIDAWSMDTFLSQNARDGLFRDIHRSSIISNTSNIHGAIRFGVEALNKPYDNQSSSQVDADVKNLLPSNTTDIVEAVLRNQAQGRGIDNDAAYTRIEGVYGLLDKFHNKYLFQDIVPNHDNNTVKFTDISLQRGTVWADWQTLESKFSDVSFLEERSYTYAWVSVADEITKYGQAPSGDNPELANLKTNLDNYTSELTALQEYVEGKIDLQNFCERFLARISSSEQDYTTLFPTDPTEENFTLRISDKECNFVFMNKKWMPQFTIGRGEEPSPVPASFRLQDGVLQKISTTDHTSTVKMLCDEQEAGLISNERLDLVEGGKRTTSAENVSSIHLHLEFIQQALNKMKAGNYTPAYRKDIATQLLENFFKAIVSDTYKEFTTAQDIDLMDKFEMSDPCSPFSSLNKELKKGAVEDFDALKSAFLDAGVDPELVNRIVTPRKETLPISLAVVGVLIVAAALVVSFFPPLGLALPALALYGAKTIGALMVGAGIYSSPTVKHYFKEHPIVPPTNNTDSLRSADFSVDVNTRSTIKEPPSGVGSPVADKEPPSGVGSPRSVADRRIWEREDVNPTPGG